VLYGCETWSVTLREEHRLRVLENRMLDLKGRKTSWRKFHNYELYGLYSLPRIVKVIK